MERQAKWGIAGEKEHVETPNRVAKGRQSLENLLNQQSHFDRDTDYKGKSMKNTRRGVSELEDIELAMQPQQANNGPVMFQLSEEMSKIGTKIFISTHRENPGQIPENTSRFDRSEIGG